jgi:hypothetical protein
MYVHSLALLREIYVRLSLLDSQLVFQHLPEPVFVNLLRSPGFDSQPGGPVTATLFVVTACQSTKAGGIDSSESIPGLLKRLQIRTPLFAPLRDLSCQPYASL